MAQTTLGDGLIIGAGDKITFGDSTVLASSPAGGFKNKIIGGDFTTNPWQRGTSFTGITAQAYTADRFAAYNNTAGAINVLKTVDSPTAAQAEVFTQHCLHLDVTTADASIAAGDLVYIRHTLEGLNVASFGFGQAGTRYVTLSFWHKHTKTGTYCVSLFNSATNRSYAAEYTQDVTNTWEKATVTLAVDTSGTWLYDTGAGIYLNWTVTAGSTYQTTANTWAAGTFFATANQVNALDNVANDFKIVLVQLESGSVATPFETRPIGTELALCQRYYYRTTPSSGVRHAGGFNISTTQAELLLKFPSTMRSYPSALEQSGTASDYAVAHGSTATNCSSVPAFHSATVDGANTRFTVASGLTAGQGSQSYSNNVSAYLGWSAEL